MPVGIAFPPWTNAWVGRRFRPRGRGPDSYDCWGLVGAVLREQFGVQHLVEQGYGWSAGWPAFAAAIAKEKDRWVAVADRADPEAPLVRHLPDRPGDVVLLRVGPWVCHCGVVVAAGWMLHIELGTASTLASYADDVDGYGRQVMALRRHPELAA